MQFTGESVHMLPLVEELGVELQTGTALTRVEDGQLVGAGAHGPGEGSWPADALVLVTQRLPRRELYDEVHAEVAADPEHEVEGVFRIGDCVAPRQQVADAIFDGHRLAREIDAADPAAARPWIRERRVLGARDEDYDRVLGAASGAPERPKGAHA
jgi:dimethylamine/trimethylamine dehydrogenase